MKMSLDDEYPPKVDFSAKKKYCIDIPSVKLITTYGEDFRGVPTKRPDAIRYLQEYPDCISGPYVDPLMTDEEISLLSNQENVHNVDEIYDKFTAKYPSLKKVALQSKVDQSKIIGDLDKTNKSTYQADYSRTEAKSGKDKDAETAGTGKRKVKLPEDWVLPRTTQRTSYRNGAELDRLGLLSYERRAKPFPPPPNNLGFTQEEHEILHTTTGSTEYEDVIGKLGDDITKNAFYGDIELLPRQLKVNKTDDDDE